MYNTKHN